MIKLGNVIGTEGKQRFREEIGVSKDDNFRLVNKYVEEMDNSQRRSGSMKLFHAGGTTEES